MGFDLVTGFSGAGKVKMAKEIDAEKVSAVKADNVLYRAVLRGVRIAPRKARLVADLIRGMPVSLALGVLDNTLKRSAPIVKNLLKSAIANAEQNAGAGLDVTSLRIRRIFVDGGATLKRYRPRAYGRGSTIRKRTCHITLVLA